MAPFFLQQQHGKKFFCFLVGGWVGGLCQPKSKTTALSYIIIYSVVVTKRLHHLACSAMSPDFGQGGSCQLVVSSC